MLLYISSTVVQAVEHMARGSAPDVAAECRVNPWVPQLPPTPLPP